MLAEYYSKPLMIGENGLWAFFVVLYTELIYTDITRDLLAALLVFLSSQRPSITQCSRKTSLKIFYCSGSYDSFSAISCASLTLRDFIIQDTYLRARARAQSNNIVKIASYN